MLKQAIWKLLNVLNKYIARPRMVPGYKRHDGVFLPLTRISNTVDIVSPQKLDIGDNVYIGHYSILDSSQGLVIEEGCQVCTHSVILTHSSHRAIRLYGSHYIEHSADLKGYVRGVTRIGKYTFIGPHTVIMPGTSIGKGSIVAAYSLIKGEFPDFAIIAGNPAQVVGDTRHRDQDYLHQYPELQSYYDEWAK